MCVYESVRIETFNSWNASNLNAWIRGDESEWAAVCSSLHSSLKSFITNQQNYYTNIRLLHWIYSHLDFALFCFNLISVNYKFGFLAWFLISFNTFPSLLKFLKKPCRCDNSPIKRIRKYIFLDKKLNLQNILSNYHLN